MSYASHSEPEQFDSVEDAPIQHDPFLGLAFFAQEFGLSVKTLSNVSIAQRGMSMKKHFSDKALRRYPPFEKGPGGQIGMWQSDYRRWRREIGHPMESA